MGKLTPYSLTFLGQATYSFFVVNPQAIKQLRAWDETDFQWKFEKARLRIRELSWVEGNTTKLQNWDLKGLPIQMNMAGYKEPSTPSFMNCITQRLLFGPRSI